MQGRTLIDIVLARCQDLGLTGASGQVDASAVELMVLHVLQSLADSFDFDTLTKVVDPLFVTSTGQDTYALPEDFGRLLMPHDEEGSGLRCRSSATNEWALVYRDPLALRRQRSTTQTRPAYFTLLAGKQLLLDPPPDANGTTGYIGVGIYIHAITAELLEGEVPLNHPAALVDMTVARLAADKSHPQTPLLVGQAEQARGRSINANARTRQQFQSRTSRTWTRQHTRVR